MEVMQMTMANLYDRLAQIGLPQQFVREKILPSWWTETVDSTPGVELTEENRDKSRPVIVVGLNDRSPSRLLFVIAHELGHLCQGHVTETPLVDDTIDFLDIDDAEEAEANEFAVELLLGQPDKLYYSSRHFKTSELVDYAHRMAARDGVDPGVVAWNYGFYRQHWGAVRGAVKQLEAETHGPTLINQCLLQGLDWGRLSDDNREYLAQMLALA